MSTRHDVAPRNWPADLADRDTVVNVFRAYGPGNHIAASRQRVLPSNVDSAVWADCTCGFKTALRRVGPRDSISAAFTEAGRLANEHIEQTL